jgi:hypothetical protein
LASAVAALAKGSVNDDVAGCGREAEREALDIGRRLSAK